MSIKFKNNRVIRLSVLICLLIFCSGFLGCGGDKVQYKYATGCASGAHFEKSSVSGTGISLDGRQACDGSDLLSDIFLYTGTGDSSVGATPDSVGGSLQSVIKGCSIRGPGWIEEDSHTLTLGSQIFYWVLCVKKEGNGNSGSRVIDVKFERDDGILTNGPDCKGQLGESFYVEKTEEVDVNVCCRDQDPASPTYGECIVDEFGNVDMSCTDTETNQYGISGQYGNYVNRGGFYDLNGGVAPRSTALCVPTTVTLDGKSVTFGFGGPACDHDGLCAYGEDSSCDDCKSCEERLTPYIQEGAAANQKNSITCQGDINLPASFSRNPFCKWCPRPYPSQPDAGSGSHVGSAVPYLLPGYSTGADASAKSGCVHVTGGDPFNCGVCGFAQEINPGTASTPLATKGLCVASIGGSNNVYCNQNGDTNYWACSDEQSGASPWFMKYSTIANPSFYYTTSEDGKGGYKSSVTTIPGATGSLPAGGGIDGKGVGSGAGAGVGSGGNGGSPAGGGGGPPPV